MSKQQQTRLFMFGCWAITLFFLLPHLVNDPISKRDDLSLINPLKNTGSLKDYVAEIKNGTILDLQPIRDLSFLINIKIEKLVGWSSFHWTNLGLWIVLCFSVHQILALSGLSTNISLFLVFLFSIHPALLTSVLWISARKHLLAAVFLLQATRLTLKSPSFMDSVHSKRSRFMIVFLYVLSIFSQPIGVLWPIWALIYDFSQKQKSKINKQQFFFYLALFSICSLSIYFNYRYYSSSIFTKDGSTKFVQHSDLIGISLLSMGRFFSQLIYPFRLAATYFPGAPLNIVGLWLSFAFFVATYKTLPKKETLIWGIFFWLPVLTVTIRMTNIFFSDTYLLLPAVGFTVISGNLIARLKWPAIFFQLKKLFFVLIAGTFLFQTSIWAQAWQSTDSLWRHSVNVEPCPTSLLVYGTVLYNNGQSDEAFFLASRLRKWEPLWPGLNRLYANSLFKSSRVPREDKIKLLTDYGSNSAWVVYTQSALYAGSKDFTKANELLKDIWKLPDFKDIDPSILAAEMEFLCVQAKDKRCHEIPGKIKTVSNKLPWVEENYRKRASELGLKLKSQSNLN